MHSTLPWPISIYVDSASLEAMLACTNLPFVKGYTTNPSLMRKAGARDYVAHAQTLCAALPDHPISFEVTADDHKTMCAQAKILHALGEKVYIKIPIINTAGISSQPVIHALNDQGIPCNITAVFTPEQIEPILPSLNTGVDNIVSVFAGRIADSGRDPQPYVTGIATLLAGMPRTTLLWASTREIYNIAQASSCGCDTITVPPQLLTQLSGLHKPLLQLSQETVQAFCEDAMAAGFYGMHEPN